MGVVAAKAKSDSVILPSAIHRSGTRSIMVRVFASFNGASLLEAISTPGCIGSIFFVDALPNIR